MPEKRPKGRPKQSWLDKLHADLKLVYFHTVKAHYRAKWRPRPDKRNPLTNGPNPGEEEHEPELTSQVALKRAENLSRVCKELFCQNLELPVDVLEYAPGYLQNMSNRTSTGGILAFRNFFSSLHSLIHKTLLQHNE